MAGSVTDALNEVYRVAKEYGIDLDKQVGDAEDVQIKALAWFAANMPEILDLPEDQLYTVTKISAFEPFEKFSGLTKEEKDQLVSELKNRQYKVEVFTDEEWEEQVSLANEVIDEILAEEEDDDLANGKGVYKYMLNRRPSEFDTLQEKEMD